MICCEDSVCVTATTHDAAPSRAISIEPIFGQIKELRRARRFQRRGLPAVDCEWKLLAMTHNILKMWRINTATIS